MAPVTEKCGACGASTTVGDADWNTVQAPALRAWQEKHIRDKHGGDGNGIVWELDPDLNSL